MSIANRIHITALTAVLMFIVIVSNSSLTVLAADPAICQQNPAAAECQSNVFDPAICQQNPDSTFCQENGKTQNPGDNSLFGPNGVMTKAARLLAVVVGVAAVIMIIIGGLKYVLASGDPSNIQSAKNTIFYAIVGLLVAALAQSIISFVLVRI